MKSYLLIDTCVWLDIAQKPKLWGALEEMENAIASETVQLIVPSQLLDELDRHLTEKASQSLKALRQQSTALRKSLKYLDDDRLSESISQELLKLEQHLSSNNSTNQSIVGKIEYLVKSPSNVYVDTSKTALLISASNRALSSRAPFHQNKNSMADALLLEACLSHARQHPNAQYYFVSLNKHDFTDIKRDSSVFHPDLQEDFEGYSVTFALNLGDVLEKVRPSPEAQQVKVEFDHIIDQGNFTCPLCGSTKIRAEGYMWSRYGALSWQQICAGCGTKFDTGEYWD